MRAANIWCCPGMRPRARPRPQRELRNFVAKAVAGRDGGLGHPVGSQDSSASTLPQFLLLVAVEAPKVMIVTTYKDSTPSIYL